MADEQKRLYTREELESAVKEGKKAETPWTFNITGQGVAVTYFPGLQP